MIIYKTPVNTIESVSLFELKWLLANFLMLNSDDCRYAFLVESPVGSNLSSLKLYIGGWRWGEIQMKKVEIWFPLGSMRIVKLSILISHKR